MSKIADNIVLLHHFLYGKGYAEASEVEREGDFCPLFQGFPGPFGSGIAMDATDHHHAAERKDGGQGGEATMGFVLIYKYARGNFGRRVGRKHRMGGCSTKHIDEDLRGSVEQEARGLAEVDQAEEQTDILFGKPAQGIVAHAIPAGGCKAPVQGGIGVVCRRLVHHIGDKAESIWGMDTIATTMAPTAEPSPATCRQKVFGVGHDRENLQSIPI